MMKIQTVILIVLLVKESYGGWNLIWNDEFDNQTLDTEKWEVENELVTCHGNYIQQNNCNTNSSKNLRLIDGTLAITAIYEKHLNKDFTSGKITTKEGFTYGRFEIRAALPKGKVLRPAIFMVPMIESTDWARNGQIDIMTYIQNSKLGAGIHYNFPEIYENNIRGDYVPNKMLHDFNIYALEWNQFEIKWFLDDINHLNLNISRKLGSIYMKNGEPFGMPFRLRIHLGVGDFNKNEDITLEDVMKWNCSLLIIDYVRIYNWVNQTQKLNLMRDNASAKKICSAVMPLITPKKLTKIELTTVFSVISSLILIVLIPIVVYLLIRQRNLTNMKSENSFENYDDIDVCEKERYTINEYTEPYQELSADYVEKDEIKQNVDKIDRKDDSSKPVYLEMTNKT